MKSLDGKVVCRFCSNPEMPIALGAALDKLRCFTPSAVNEHKQLCCNTRTKKNNLGETKSFLKMMDD